MANVTKAGGFYRAAGTKHTVRERVPVLRDAVNARRAPALEGAPCPDSPQPRSFLPAGGEDGPEALRSHRRLRIPAHRATSDMMAGAYPFLAEAGLGSAGVYIGQDAWSGGGFCFDPWVLYQQGILTNPNALLAGVVGKGKSCLAKSIATRSIAFGRRVYVPGDPKGEWSIVADAVGGTAIRLGAGTGNRLNPLDPGPRDPSLNQLEWQAALALRRRTLVGSLAQSALGRPLASVEHTALDVALNHAAEATEVPTLPAVVDALLAPTTSLPGATAAELGRDGRDLGHALRRLVAGDLAGLFDGPSTTTFDPAAPMVTLDLSRIQGSDTLIAMVMTCASAWMESALASSDGGQRWVIYDEAWRLMRQPALLARMQSQWELSRGLGIANLLIIHRLSDLDAVGDRGSESRALARGLLGTAPLRSSTSKRSARRPRPQGNSASPAPNTSSCRTCSVAKDSGASGNAPSWSAT
jgi:hypothetical protein